MEINSFAIIRAVNSVKAKTTIIDLQRYAKLTVSDSPRVISPTFADEILEEVMKKPLLYECGFATIVPLNNDASESIGWVRKIHPPSHIVIVSPEHEVFNNLLNYYSSLPIFETN